MSFAKHQSIGLERHLPPDRENVARTMCRIALGLFVACNVLAATAFSAHSNYSSICEFVDERQQAAEFGEEDLTRLLKSDFCS